MITEWKPISRPQEVFLGLPDTLREGFFGGAAGPGKSECLMMYPIVREFYKRSRFKALFMRRTYSELKLEIIPRSRELYEAVGGKFNKSDLVWEFPEYNSYIFFGHCEHEADVHKYDSMEINLFLPDELESFLEYQYLYIAFTRVRSSDSNLPALIRAAGMPGGIGHTWVKKRFIDPCPTGGKVIIGKGGNKRIYIHSTLADNPKIDKAYANALEALPDAEKKAKKYGDWSSYEGQVFDEFRELHYPEEPENAIHVVESFPIPSWWPRIIGIDWGFAPPAMTWVGYAAISPDKKVYIYREQYWQKTKISEWTPYVREFIEIEHPKVIKLCKSSSQDRGQEHTILEQISSELKYSVELTSNNSGSRVANKMLLHEYLRWKPVHVVARNIKEFDNDHATWLLRNKSYKEYNSYLSSFNPPTEETGIPKLQIFKECKMLIEAIKSCTYDKTNTQDVAEFNGDDPYDGLRYIVDASDRYFAESVTEFERVQAQEEISRRFAETQDYNYLHRQARILESNNRTKGVSRYRHGRIH